MARNSATGTFGQSPIGPTSSITAKPLDSIFAATGTTKDGMYKIVFGREVTMPCDCVAGKEMGINTWAAFRGSDEHAIVDGDFACIHGELQSVLKTLRAHHINVVAIHNHMEAEAPRIIFLHYWATGRADELAKAIKSALDARPEHSEHSMHDHHEHAS